MTEEEIIQAVKEAGDLNGMTVNERLFNTGLMKEFDRARLINKEKARLILRLLLVDEPSIKKILSPFHF